MPGALVNDVHAEPLLSQHRRDHVLLERITHPRRAGLPGHLHTLVDLLRHKAASDTLGFRADHAAQANRAGTENRHIRSRPHPGLPDGIDRDRQRFAQRALLTGNRPVSGEAALLGHHDELAETTVALPRRTEKAKIETRVLPALPALVAPMARDRRLHNDQISHLDPLDRRPDLGHRGRAFVPHNERELNHLGTDPSGLEVVNVRTADTDFLYLQHDICFFVNRGIGDLPDLHPADAGQNRCFHRLQYSCPTMSAHTLNLKLMISPSCTT